MNNDYQPYTQDYLQENEEICDFCRAVRNHKELQELESDERGGTVIVCNNCIQDGRAER